MNADRWSLATLACLLWLGFGVPAALATWTPLGPSAGAVRSLARDATSGALYAGTYAGGVFQSTDGGASWSSVAPEIRGQTVDAIATGAPGTVFAGTYSNGLWRSTNGGATWKRVLFGGAQMADRHAAFQAISVDPANPRVVIAATDAGFNAGVWRSADGGDTWKHSVLGLPNNFRLSAIAIDPARSDTVYLGTLSDGAYKSTDGGATWTLSGESLRSAGVLSFAFDASGTVYAGTMGGGLHRSTDAGTTWTAFTDKPIARARVHAIVVDPTNPAVMWAGIPNALLRTTDGGRRWTDTLPSLDYATVRAVVLDPAKPSAVFAGTTRDGVLRTDDGGRTWSGQHAGFFALDVAGVATDPSTPKAAWLATSSGVWRTDDGGATWALRSDGITQRGVNCIATHPATRQLYACTGDGVFRSVDGGRKWTKHGGGFGASTRIIGLAFDTSNPSVVYARDPSWAFVSGDGGETWKRAADIGAEGVLNGLFALATIPGKPGTLVASTYRNVMKSTDGATTFAKSNSGLPLSRVQAVVSDADGTMLWAATEGEGVWRSTDAGATWTDSRKGMGAVNVQALLVDTAHPGTLYAAVWKQGVYRSGDAGRTWTLVAGSPPHPDVITLALDPSTPGALIVGTGGGGAWRVTVGAR